jgi:hypothetical protein
LAAEPRPWHRMPCRAREAHDVVHGQEEHLVGAIDDQVSSFSTSSRTAGTPCGIARARAEIGEMAQRLPAGSGPAAPSPAGTGSLISSRRRCSAASPPACWPAAPADTAGQPHALAQVALGIALQREAAFGHRLAQAHAVITSCSGLRERACMCTSPAATSGTSVRSPASSVQRGEPEVVVDQVRQVDAQPQRGTVQARKRRSRSHRAVMSRSWPGTRLGTNNTSQPCSSVRSLVSQPTS